MKFKIDDRVLVSGKVHGKLFKHERGVVVGLDADRGLEVQFDDWDKGHNGNDSDWDRTDRWFIDTDCLDCVAVIDRAPSLSQKSLLPQDAKERKEIPLASGMLDYFTSALIEVAKVSFTGNQQHNPGEPLHWSQDKSADHADTMLRHFVERGTLDTDGQRHSAKVAWRALAMLQMELQNDGYPKARGAK
jgi:hypothetical protein